MWRIALFGAFLLLHTVVSQDSSGCAVCDDQFLDWNGNKTHSSWWTVDRGAKDAADGICDWAKRLRDDCYKTCARDPNGFAIPGGSRRAVSLRRFVNNNCYDHACRLEDLTYCFKHTEVPEGTPISQKKCTDEVLNCEADIHDANGCNDNQLCHEAERRSFAEKLKSRVKCHFGSQTIMSDDANPNTEDGQHLQQCPYILLAECLKQWTEDPTRIDMNKFVKLTPTNQDNICSNRNEAESCLNKLDNGGLGYINYANYNYTEPCRVAHLQYPDELKTVRNDLLAVYVRLCDSDSDDYIRTACADDGVTTTMSGAPVPRQTNNDSNNDAGTENSSNSAAISADREDESAQPSHDHSKGASTGSDNGASNRLQPLAFLFIIAFTVHLMF